MICGLETYFTRTTRPASQPFEFSSYSPDVISTVTISFIWLQGMSGHESQNVTSLNMYEKDQSFLSLFK